LNGAVYLVQDLHVGGEAIVDLAVPTGAAIDRGEVWRPLTSLVVHPGGLVHLGTNTVLLAALGASAEHELTRNQILATYLGGGFAANAARYALGGRTGGGASAAIFAVAGAALSSRLHRSDRAREADVAAFALIAGGSMIAASASDNHLLALGLGGAMGRAAAKPSRDRRFMEVVGAVTVAALVAMVGRRASS
jgi:membrane associated rhomboid family serine protease